MLKRLYPDAFVGGLVCDASGQCFGRGRDLHVLHTCVSDRERREGLRRRDAEGSYLHPSSFIRLADSSHCRY